MISYSNKQLNLEWEGPYSIKDNDIYTQTLPGLYLFTILHKGEYFVQYIGKTRMPISSRLVGYGGTTGHLRDAVSGRYFLYEPAQRRNLSLVTAYKLDDNFGEFFMNLEKYQAIARQNLEDTAFFFCTFQDQLDLVEIAEGILILTALKPNNPDFPIIENSRRGVAPATYGSGIIISNRFPDSAVVRGFAGLLTDENLAI